MKIINFVQGRLYVMRCNRRGSLHLDLIILTHSYLYAPLHHTPVDKRTVATHAPVPRKILTHPDSTSESPDEGPPPHAASLIVIVSRRLRDALSSYVHEIGLYPFFSI